ncbi:hypothetical protein ADK86_24380 [Streptomyces sp. NRRL F-5755]|uniref:zeta toxin family protein n=1 Tax=Streptomyces sp. NRRL F-5755 TaxID=1519475 RepID=UPI0006AEB10F|nr:zeta toxin family protein [Streptomyces sp. NRRL F-5755]KOT91092.1 hypothetical protein ADK86_24380 [Streptomyces sp. NRRL F-5755]
MELVVLAVRVADSRQGTAARYAERNRRGLPARFTMTAGYDAGFRVLADVAAEAERQAVVDSVVVLRCDGHVLYRNERIAAVRWLRCPGAALAVAAEQSRSCTSGEAARFWSVQRQLRSAMPHCCGEFIAIERLARPLVSLPLRRRRRSAVACVAALPASV